MIIMTNAKVTMKDKIKNVFCDMVDCKNCENKENCNEYTIKTIKERENNGKRK